MAYPAPLFVLAAYCFSSCTEISIYNFARNTTAITRVKEVTRKENMP